MPRVKPPSPGAKGGPPSAPDPSDDTLADDPIGKLLGSAQLPPQDVNAIVGLLSTGEGMDSLLVLCQQDPATYGLAMARLRVYARRRALGLEQTIAARAAQAQAARGVLSTVQAQLGELAPEEGQALNVPWSYRLDEAGVWRVAAGGVGADQQIASAPVLLIGWDRDIDTQRVQVRLAWRHRGEWLGARVNRGLIVDSRCVGTLADLGAPWTQAEAKEMVRYLSLFERANPEIALARSVSSAGWRTQNGRSVFLLPDRALGGAGDVHLAIDPEGPLADAMEGWRPKGTFEGWRDVVSALRAFPLALFGAYASLAAPLLWILHAPCFAVDWSGLTSGGKSTTLRLAASVWGDPEDGAGVFHSWADTATHVERWAAALHALPVILDDTKAYRHAAGGVTPSRLVYLFAQGRGRGRGTVAGVMRTPTWRTILLSSGEAPLVSRSGHAGASARVLHVRGKPFGEDDAQGRQLADWTRAALAKHHGHAGERFVRHLLDHVADWPIWTEACHAHAQLLASRFPGRITGRLAGYLAVIDLARQLSTEALGLPKWPTGEDPVEIVGALVLRHAAAEDTTLEAFDAAVNWATANQARFWPRADRRPTLGWAGRWDREGETIWMLPSALYDVLRGQGHRLDEVEDAWAARDLLWTRGREHLKAVKIDGEQAKCLGLRVRAGVEPRLPDWAE